MSRIAILKAALRSMNLIKSAAFTLTTDNYYDLLKFDRAVKDNVPKWRYDEIFDKMPFEARVAWDSIVEKGIDLSAYHQSVFVQGAPQDSSPDFSDILRKGKISEKIFRDWLKEDVITLAAARYHKSIIKREQSRIDASDIGYCFAAASSMMSNSITLSDRRDLMAKLLNRILNE